MGTLTERLNQAKAELEKSAPNVQAQPKVGAEPPKEPRKVPKKTPKVSQQDREPVWRPKLENKGGSLRLVYKTQVQNHTAELSNEIADSKATEYLYPLVKPLCKLINAVVNRGIKALDSPGPRHVLDAKGRPTREVEKDDNGKPINLPSALDIAKSAYAEMMRDPEAVKLLSALSKRLNILQDALSEDPSDSDDDNGRGGGNTSPYQPMSQ